jgi:hypothetical protein
MCIEEGRQLQGGDSFRGRGRQLQGGSEAAWGKGERCFRMGEGGEMLDSFRVRTENNTVALRNKIKAHHAYSVVDPA